MPTKKGPVRVAAQSSDAELHVRIAEPMMIRRTVLNLALDTIQLMKRYDSIIAIRKRKYTMQQKLARTYGDIRKLSSQIKLKELPGMPRREPPKRLEIPKQAMPKPVLEKPKLIRKVDLSPLEEEMDEIRRKLAGL